MKRLYLLVVLGCLGLSLQAQVIYSVNFDSGSFPAGWTAFDGRVMLLNNVSSCCYSSSPTSPEASGLYNVIFQHCAPPSSTLTLTVAGVISTVGKTNIRVGFGRRSTSAWDRPMALEWSSNGTNWNLVDSDVSAGASTTWGSTYYDLPASADNVANLRFRFSFTTTTNQNCTAPPNFRIDDFTVGANFSLPAELSRFDAQAINKQAYVTWATNSETDNAYFAVEHSTNGQDFTELGQVTGSGTTREQRQYFFWHKNPESGLNYYRLRQVDGNDRSVFSIIRTLNFNSGSAFRVFPSPASDFLQIKWERKDVVEEGVWGIFDPIGRQLLSGPIDAQNTEMRISLNSLPVGLLLFRIRWKEHVAVQTFIKN